MYFAIQHLLLFFSFPRVVNYAITLHYFVILTKLLKGNLTQSRRDAKITQRESLKNALRLSGFAVKNYNLIRANPRHPRYPRSILVADLLRYAISPHYFVILTKLLKGNLTQSRRDAKITQRKSLKSALRFLCDLAALREN